MAKKFYITTAIPYVNAPPHVGHALEFVQTDIIARYHRLLGEDVRFQSGADENALKNVESAEKEGIPVEELVKKNSESFRCIKEKLNISFDDFIYTTDKRKHWPGVYKLWKACDKTGDIYKKKYRGLYCVGCEEFKFARDLDEEGKCPEHNKKPEVVEEKNYFFRLSKYQKQLEKLIESDQLKIVPEKRKNETLSFIKSGLEDFSISRSKERAKGWGIPVPGDDSQIIYVWYDALANYITALDYGREDSENFKKYWPADLHVIGKGILRFHAVYWPAMLISAGIEIPKEIFIHGYITAEGQKISKTIGNVIDPYEVAEKYGIDATRYYFLRAIPPFDDGDFSIKRFEEIYNADLANGLGNLVARVAKLCERSGVEFPPVAATIVVASSEGRGQAPPLQLKKAMAEFRFDEALGHIWKLIAKQDKLLDEKEPWKQEGEALKETLTEAVRGIREIAYLLQPFLPETAEKIQKQFAGLKIQSEESLFPRLKKPIV